MFYTLAFYIITALLCFNTRDRKKVMKAVFTFAAIYMSLRYNYPSDYPAYQNYFNMVNSGGYEYSETDHMEYGWYLINRLFSPFGYYIFVAFCSCVLAYGLYLVSEAIVPKVYFPLVALGIFAMGSFEILMSAQRQLLVVGIFLIAYRKLIYQRMDGFWKLFNKRTLLYFVIIILCSYFHKAAIILVIIPFMYLIPKKSFVVILGLGVIAVLLQFYGDLFLVDFFEQLQEETGEYSYMVFTGEYSGTVSFLQASMWIFQFACVAVVYTKYTFDNNEKVIMLLSMLSIFIIMAGFSLGQFARLSHFIYVFSFLSIAVIAQKFRGTSFAKPYIYINWAWVVWNMLKVFSIPRGTLYEYKLLLFNLI